MSIFEYELNNLINRTNSINPPKRIAPINIDLDEYNRPSDEWINDVDIFYHKYLKDHPLASRIETILFHRDRNAYNDLIACLNSISRDQDFINKMNNKQSISNSTHKDKTYKEYDVFLSHANADKIDFVDELYSSLDVLGINIFYDKESLEWGDKWKKRILDGVKASEFAIIVISENFFDREWTERELSEFLNMQNQNGQKIILPILHNITINDLNNKYPEVADIQAISSKDYTCDRIALLFGEQLIKRIKR